MAVHDEVQRMRLIDYLNLARERVVVVVAVVVVACAAVVGLTFLQDPAYAAQARVRLSLPIPESDPLVREVQADVNTEAELVKSTQVATAVAGALGSRRTPADLLDDVDVAPVPNTAVVEITATTGDAEGAVRLVNAFANQFVAVRQATLENALQEQAERLGEQQQDLQERHARVSRALTQVEPGSQEALALEVEQTGILSDLVQLRTRIDSLSRVQADTRNRYEIIRTADRAATVRSTSLPRALVFGLLIGIPLALAAILLLDSLRSTIRGRDDVELLSGVEVLGVVPVDRAWSDGAEPRLAVVSDALSPVADAYRTLAHNVSRVAAARGAQTLLVTSPGDGDGKTSVAVTLGLVSSDAGRRTLLLEADLRHPRAHTFLRMRPDPGLTDVLAGNVEVADVVQSLGGELEFIGAGSVADRPDLLIGRGRVDELLTSLAARGRPKGRTSSSISPTLVVIDSSPVLGAAEVSTLAAAADAVLLVARVGVTSRQGLRAAADQVRRAGGSLLGAVVIGARSVADHGSLTAEIASDGGEIQPQGARASKPT